MNLIKGDCLVELKKLPDKSINFFYLDLPYGQTSCDWDVKLDHEALWIELKRLAKSDRTPFFFSCTTKFGFELYNSAPKNYFRWDLVWRKNRAAGFLNAYRLPMRKHEMIYCFAKKTPEYDLSSHKEFTLENNQRGQIITKDIYGRIGKKRVKGKIWKDKLPTSDVTPPDEDHELVYCFAKKCPHYDISSHTEYEENEKINVPRCPLYGKQVENFKAKSFKEKLPTSDITQPAQDHELVYCFAKKTPEYDVSSHKEYTENKEQNHGTPIYGNEINILSSKTHNERLPTSDITPSSWCDIKNDEGIDHRTAKPVKLMEFLLKYWTKEGDVVCDPTAGSGSMGVACKNMNRKFIGIEKDEDIYKLMCDRINNPDKLIKKKRKPRKN